MKLKITSLLFVLLGAWGSVKSQVHQRQELTWFRYYGSYEMSENWKVKAEIEYRNFQPQWRPHQLLLPRLHVERKLASEFKVGVGAVYFLHWLPHDAEVTEKAMRIEYRPHQYITQGHLFKWGSFKQRWMIEQRWRQNIINNEAQNSYRFNFRFRYSATVQVHLNQDKQWVLQFSAEPMLNAGRSIRQDYLDQVRTSLGTRISLTEHIDLSLDYINWYQPVIQQNRVYLRDIARFTIYHEF